MFYLKMHYIYSSVATVGWSDDNLLVLVPDVDKSNVLNWVGNFSTDFRRYLQIFRLTFQLG